MSQELMRTRCAQGQLIITDTAIIIELAIPGAGHRDVLMRQSLTGVDVKRAMFTAATITFYGQGQQKLRATMVKAKEAERIQALLLGLP
jgi:hypothetical protein